MRIDHFESAFKSAAKTVFEFQPITIEKILVITDLSAYECKLFGERARAFLSVLRKATEWTDIDGEHCQSVGDLLDLVERERPDLIVTYRHIHSGAWRWPYGLGEHLDVLTQVTTTPVLVMPRPDDDVSSAKVDNTDRVMAMTSRLSGDHYLVSYAAKFTEPKGALFLTHVEDRAAFERISGVIAKIPEIDTQPACEEIKKQLLKEASDFIDSCASEIERAGVPISVERVVTLGDHLADYKALVATHEIDLLVLNTKDQDQLAMHGLAYPLAVELRGLPLLML